MVNPNTLHCKTRWKHPNPSTSVIMQAVQPENLGLARRAVGILH